MNKGFTLIETILYIALLSLLIGGALFVSFNLIDNSSAIRIKFITEEEVGFILKKINWALTGVQTINSPSPGTTSSSLSITRFGLPAFQNPLVFSASSGMVMMTRGSGTAVEISSDNVTVQNLLFTRTTSTPEAVRVDFSINNVSSSMTKYLRK